MSKPLLPFCVIYHAQKPTSIEPLCFKCEAENADFAESLCEFANPGAEVVWVVQTDDPVAAMDDWFTGALNEWSSAMDDEVLVDEF